MTVSIRRISLGCGYEYLIKSVARGDGAADTTSPLTRYYAEAGTPPGRFLGAGLGGLAGGAGVAAGSEVSEQALWRMLGLLADPVTGDPLGRAPRAWPKTLLQRISDRARDLPALDPTARANEVARIDAEEAERERRITRPVAGFDLTFSVAKSVSAVWAIADGAVQATIYQAHRDAIDVAIGYAERHVFFSRTGTNGVRQEAVRGVVAAAFDHWDSRAGDPHLHTHVTVLNRVQTVDGRWRTLDSRTLFKYVVALSELHEGVLADLLTERLGVGWDERGRRHSAVPRHDVAGVPDALITEFSQRADQIETAKNDLVAEFAASRGRQPSSVEVLRLRQRATLATRPDKQHRALAGMTESWRHRARPFVGDDTVAWVATLRDRCDLPALRSANLADEILGDAATAARTAVASRRATFSHANLLAETHRQLHGIQFAHPSERIDVGRRIAEQALAQAVHLTTDDAVTLSARIYTTREILDAEDRLLEAGRTRGAAGVPLDTIEQVIRHDLPNTDHRLGPDQAAAVGSIATSGRMLDLLVGPAGTGKTTSLAGLRAIWERQYGPGSVVGLAPSAAAAEVLADELRIDTENTAKWLVETARNEDRRARIADLDAKLTRTSNGGSVLARELTTRRRILFAEIERWSLHPGQLLIVDEASLAGTLTLDQIAVQVRDARAKVLLVGDWAQLSSIEAGGAFTMLVRDRADVPELTSVRRFINEWERDATTQLRVGNPAAIEAYQRHDRIHSGDRRDMLDAIYHAWRNDAAAGLASLMIAPDLETAAELNMRVRNDRAASADERTVDLADGTRAGIGDRVVTRQNDRKLSIGQQWVKNGDAWTVHAVNGDGSVTVAPDNGTGRLTLPANYMSEHVELGYAATAYRAQGRTVDSTHVLVNPTTTREVLYVAATRGRLSNHLYVDTYADPDPESSHDLTPPPPGESVLRAIVSKPQAEASAHTVIEHIRHHETPSQRETWADPDMDSSMGTEFPSAQLIAP